MKTLPELLRDADPLRYEPPRSAQKRRVTRQRVPDSPRVIGELPRPRVLIVAAVAVTLLGIAAGSRHWSQVGVDVVAAVRFEVRLAEENPASGLREAVVSGAAGRRIYLHQETVVTNSDIARAQVIPGDAASTFSVTVTFDADGAAKMLRATQSHMGRPLAILVDGEVMIAPVVRSPITTSAIISGSFTRAEAERVAAGILGR
jgi:hypothetical protein